jgi:aquaporin Z
VTTQSFNIPSAPASVTAQHDTPRGAALDMLRAHWPEYLIEGWALGMFMISAGVITTLFDYPGSPVNRFLGNGNLQRVLIGLCMGFTAMALIYSPWGKRSGAHMNPAVTLTFLRLGHVARWDAFFYIVAQFAGGTLGVLLVSIVLGDAFALPPVRYVATLPGTHGVAAALAAEFVISFAMMMAILQLSNSQRLMRYTGIGAGILVATWIGVEGPLSGMSMNPARTFASALLGDVWTAFWIYVLAPIAGMQAAATLFVWRRGRRAVKCSKLIHADDQRCIHCGFQPSPSTSETGASS